MGELADDMVAGITCSDCGMFFRDPDNKDALYEHGYPVVCQKCWSQYSEKERKQAKRNGIQVATAKLFN